MINGTSTYRVPDCVTEVHMGNSVLTVSGFLKQDATDTAADKMMRVFKAERAADTDDTLVEDAGIAL